MIAVAQPSHDRRNTPRIPCADFVWANRRLTSAENIVGKPLKVFVPKSLRRRRVYVCAPAIVAMTGVNNFPSFRGTVDFRLDGALVQSWPMTRFPNPGGPSVHVEIQPGAEAKSVWAGNNAYPGFQPGEADSLVLSYASGNGDTYPTELVVPPHRLTLTCDQIELNLSSFTGADIDGDDVFLACHSEGETDA